MKISAHLDSINQNLIKLKSIFLPEQALALKSDPRQDAIDVLLNRGETRVNAELIVKAMEEWALDYDLAASLDFKVVGESVWINNEE